MTLRAAFVYQNARAQLVRAAERGDEPDSTLLGMNHLGGHGIDAFVHDPLLTRRPLPAPLDRIAWNARELTIPWELGRADVLFTPLAALLPLAARTRPRLHTVVVNYGLNLIHRRAGARRRRLLERSLRAAARVVCLGESQREYVVEEIGVPAERATTLLLPVDERWWSPREAPREELVLTAGKDLARDFATFAAAVDGLAARAELALFPRNLEGVALPPNATAGRLSSPELRERYARAAVVVVPQRRDDYAYGSEGGGLTALLEAMAMARPVVATERAILRDYVTDGEDALLVPPEDPAALRAAIERVLGDPALGARLGAAARARVERAHSTRGFARQLAPLFRSVAGRVD